MKTAEHYLMRWRDNEFELHELIELAQKEAYNQALVDAAEKSKVSLFDWINDGFKEFKQNSNHYSINDGTYVKIDEQSILKLKK
jgi:hypothetical protein